MSKAGRGRAAHTVWFWSKAEFARFQQAVERFVAAVADLETILNVHSKRAMEAAAKKKAKNAAASAKAEMQRLAAEREAAAPPIAASPDGAERGAGE